MRWKKYCMDYCGNKVFGQSCYVLRKNEEQDKQEAAREAACQELLKQFAEELHALREEKEKKNTASRK